MKIKIIILTALFINISSFASPLFKKADGGGPIKNKIMDTDSVIESLNKWNDYQNDKNKLIYEGKLKLTNQNGTHPLYQFPLTTNQSYPGFYGISNYVDTNSNFPDQLLDYNCGMRTYDRPNGYNHAGIDYFTWPYGWNKIDNDEVQVIAAAAGTITTKADGNFDRVCDPSSPLNTGWNAVYVTHSDGSVAWYGHLKSGSLTAKLVGDTVAAGEYLGIVGSSGNSTGPHLHFETYDNNGFLIEPYFGACNSLNNDSWWVTQKPYHDSKLNQIITHTVAPASASCPNTTDSLNDSNYFDASDTIYFAAYYRDQLLDQVSSFEILRPDNSTFQSWAHSSNAEHYAASNWYWIYTLSSNPQNGRWTFKVTYEGVITNHYFYVGDEIFSNGFE